MILSYFVKFFHLFAESFILFACLAIGFIFLARAKRFHFKVFGFGFAIFGLSTFIHILFYPDLPNIVYYLRVVAGFIFVEALVFEFLRGQLYSVIPPLPILPLTNKIISSLLFSITFLIALLNSVKHRTKIAFLILGGFLFVFLAELAFWGAQSQFESSFWVGHHLLKFFGFLFLLFWAFEVVKLSLGARMYINF